MDYRELDQLEREKEAKADAETMRLGCTIFVIAAVVDVSIVWFFVWLLN